METAELDVLEKSWDERWARRHERGWREPLNRRIVRAIEAQSRSGELPPGAEVLDLGCGAGRYLVPLAAMGYRVTGVDISGTALAEARAKLREGHEVRLLQNATTHLAGVDDESMHLALSTGAIHHNSWEGIEESFAEVALVLRPGKHFLFVERAIGDTAAARRAVTDRGVAARDTEGGKAGVLQHYFSEDELFQLAGAHGFEMAARPVPYVLIRRHDPHGTGRLRWFVDYRKKQST
jgi:SAM-dependent methyltransferase